jgi:hypothetical protein
MADFRGKFGRRKEDAIVALCSTRSIEDAARTCNTPARTLYRWLKEPDFDAAYRCGSAQRLRPIDRTLAAGIYRRGYNAAQGYG